MKKKILFCCYGFGIGGIEKCMINLLNKIDTTKYEIDVLPMNPEYALLPALHADVQILEPFDYVMNTTDTVNAFREKKEGLFVYLKYAAFRIVNKWGHKPWRFFKAPEKHYDIAIAYAHTGYVPYYVIDCVDAERKYMWHHEGRYVKDEHYSLDQEYYPKLDAIVAVSEDDRRILTDAFPELKKKIKVLYNLVDKEEIRLKAKAPIEVEKNDEVLKITTVGRLSHQKGPDILLDVAEKLRDSSVAFRWYWVGSGDLDEFLRNGAKERGLENQIILMGNQSNPYPYMSFCDIYVQPSYYEAFCTTTMEAQVLEKPIVVTDVCGMREQFTPDSDCIMTNVDAEEIFQAIFALASDKEKCQQLSANLHRKMQKDDGILQTYYDFFNF